MSIWNKPQQLFTATAPDLKSYIGKKVRIDGKKVIIQTIVGNKWHPKFYEINSEHLMGMLRFHAQMTGADDITEEQFLAFEAMDVEVEKLPDNPKINKDVKNEQDDSPTTETKN